MVEPIRRRIDLTKYSGRPKPNREEIRKIVEDARRNLEKDKNIKFEFEDYKLRYFKKDVDKLLVWVGKQIKLGKRPVIILPDTSMRSAGMLFHAALRTAFPELFSKDKLPIVFFVAPNENSNERLVKILSPNLIKLLKTNNCAITIFDESTAENSTYRAIKRKLNEYNSNITPEQHQVIQSYYQFSFARSNILGPRYNASTEFEYSGKNGVMKPFDKLPEGYPELVVAKREHYIDREEEYRKQFLMRKEMFKLGIQIGKEFRKKLFAGKV